MWLRLFAFTIVLQLLLMGVDTDLDITFGTDGKVTMAPGGWSGFYGKSVAIQSDGKIVVAGKSNNEGNYGFSLLRYQGTAEIQTPVPLAPHLLPAPVILSGLWFWSFTKRPNHGQLSPADAEAARTGSLRLK